MQTIIIVILYIVAQSIIHIYIYVKEWDTFFKLKKWERFTNWYYYNKKMKRVPEKAYFLSVKIAI